MPGVVGERSSQVGEVPEWVGDGEGRFVADGDSSAVVRRAISADMHVLATGQDGRPKCARTNVLSHPTDSERIKDFIEDHCSSLFPSNERDRVGLIAAGRAGADAASKVPGERRLDLRDACLLYTSPSPRD